MSTRKEFCFSGFSPPNTMTFFEMKRKESFTEAKPIIFKKKNKFQKFLNFFQKTY
jgi:hypothetical protein